MQDFKIIFDLNEMRHYSNWEDVKDFKSKNRIVDVNGKEVALDYKGNRYQIIGKKERALSIPEQIKRGIVGIVAVICTLCLALFSKSVRKLFKSKTHIRFGILIPKQVSTRNISAVSKSTLPTSNTEGRVSASNEVSANKKIDNTLTITPKLIDQPAKEPSLTALDPLNVPELVKDTMIKASRAPLSSSKEIPAVKVNPDNTQKMSPETLSRNLQSNESPTNEVPIAQKKDNPPKIALDTQSIDQPAKAALASLNIPEAEKDTTTKVLTSPLLPSNEVSAKKANVDNAQNNSPETRLQDLLANELPMNAVNQLNVLDPDPVKHKILEEFTPQMVKALGGIDKVLSFPILKNWNGQLGIENMTAPVMRGYLSDGSPFLVFGCYKPTEYGYEFAANYLARNNHKSCWDGLYAYVQELDLGSPTSILDGSSSEKYMLEKITRLMKGESVGAIKKYNGVILLKPQDKESYTPTDAYLEKTELNEYMMLDTYFYERKPDMNTTDIFLYDPRYSLDDFQAMLKQRFPAMFPDE